MTSAPTERRKKSPAGEPTIKVNHGRLQIVYRFKQSPRKYFSLNLSPSKSNDLYAERIRAWMASDLLNDNFDETLDRYRRESVKPDPNAPNSNINPELTIVRVWDEYVDFKRSMVAPSTIAKDYAAVSKYIGSPSIPQNLTEGTGVAVRDYLLANTTLSTTKRVLVNLCACFRWAIDSRLVTENPFAWMSANVNIPKSEKDELFEIDSFSSKRMSEKSYCSVYSG